MIGVSSDRCWLQCLELESCLQVMTCQGRVRTMCERQSAASTPCSATSAVSITPHRDGSAEIKVVKLLANPHVNCAYGYCTSHQLLQLCSNFQHVYSPPSPFNTCGRQCLNLQPRARTPMSPTQSLGATELNAAGGGGRALQRFG